MGGGEGGVFLELGSTVSIKRNENILDVYAPRLQTCVHCTLLPQVSEGHVYNDAMYVIYMRLILLCLTL